MTDEQKQEVIKTFINKRSFMDYPSWQELKIEDKLELLANVVQAMFESPPKENNNIDKVVKEVK